MCGIHRLKRASRARRISLTEGEEEEEARFTSLISSIGGADGNLVSCAKCDAPHISQVDS